MSIENTGFPADFKQLIVDTANAMQISQDTVVLLLLKYGWDVRSMKEDHLVVQEFITFMNRCHQSNGLVFSGAVCPLCFTGNGCFVLACGHRACDNCIRVAIRDQLANRELMIVCPVEDCSAFVLWSTLPNPIQSNYVDALVRDYKTAPFRKGLKFVWRHRVKFVMAYQIVGKVIPLINTAWDYGNRALAWRDRALAWRQENPWKSWMVESAASWFV